MSHFHLGHLLNYIFPLRRSLKLFDKLVIGNQWINVAKTSVYYVFVALVISACDNQDEASRTSPLFVSVPSSASNVNFVNSIEETRDFYYFKYIYSYIGGGVAAADFNNDGLVDLFFTSNLNPHKLYLNKGNLQFEDITENSGIKKREGFDTGVSVADVNQDGYLDLYICRAGWEDSDEYYENQLYINNGDLTFTERAAEFGLNDRNRSISATFFDYDKDGDLDVYVSNAVLVDRNYKEIPKLSDVEEDPGTDSLRGSDKLYRNEGNGYFTDQSFNAGILPEKGFGLHPQVGDLNQDGWLDIYVTNDFTVPDFAFINNQNGTFSKRQDQFFKHISYYSMGADIGDINNDGLVDLMVLDMSPEDYVRSKTTMAMISNDKFNTLVNKGYHYQYMHNVLQVNNGNNSFSEIAYLAGVANTDWSWSALLADFDLDGLNDIYVTNGIFRDVIDQDKSKEIVATLRANNKKPTDEDFLRFTQSFPQQKLKNYFFKNLDGLSFEDKSSSWVENPPTFSNGAVYADLDNDGDLEIVVNNINDEATILKNTAIERKEGNFLQFQFKGPPQNQSGVGVKVNLHLADNAVLTRQLINTRGFLSSVSNKLHFGLGQINEIPSAEIIWPDGRKQKINSLAVNQIVQVDIANADQNISWDNINVSPPIKFKKTAFNYHHKEVDYDDYQKQLLLPHKLSQTGPATASADVNGDGYVDLFIGGAYQQTSLLLLGKSNGGFIEQSVPDFRIDSLCEDVGAVFFDADMDGDQDLYIVSGSYEFEKGSDWLQDRLYLNDGLGQFTKASNALPNLRTANSVVMPSDIDHDGDLDLFVGGRVIKGKYPYPPQSYLLINRGGVFEIGTPNLAPELENIGMITDAVWTDIDRDQDDDLILTGEWMGIEVFTNEKGKFKRSKQFEVLNSSVGWWNTLIAEDIDEDGDMDIIAGNLGLNYKYHASEEKPFHVYTSDFDLNGVEDIILAKYYDDKQVPVRGKSCTSQQIPILQTKIKSYNEFASKDLYGIFGSGLDEALHLKATEFRSGLFIQDENGFTFSPFENVAQISTLNSILYEDFDGDGIRDLLLAGNNYVAEIETTRADAGIGAYFKGLGKGKFEYVENSQTGFFADKDVRSMLYLNNRNDKSLIVINNNDTHDHFQITIP
ncbi:VCBS repeat-containing protein [Flexithrix dorotheae]|uniref:VCBS repeat-containing protein n=1 Tax=Flexithrix dorotheae TaxID=70993 RepID=UPI00036D3D73|nr:VCBS repeat-containing protein [Flexithrix dorotheae]